MRRKCRKNCKYWYDSWNYFIADIAELDPIIKVVLRRIIKKTQALDTQNGITAVTRCGRTEHVFIEATWMQLFWRLFIRKLYLIAFKPIDQCDADDASPDSCFPSHGGKGSGFHLDIPNAEISQSAQVRHLVFCCVIAERTVETGLPCQQSGKDKIRIFYIILLY